MATSVTKIVCGIPHEALLFHMRYIGAVWSLPDEIIQELRETLFFVITNSLLHLDVKIYHSRSGMCCSPYESGRRHQLYMKHSHSMMALAQLICSLEPGCKPDSMDITINNYRMDVDGARSGIKGYKSVKFVCYRGFYEHDSDKPFPLLESYHLKSPEEVEVTIYTGQCNCVIDYDEYGEEYYRPQLIPLIETQTQI